VKQVCSKHGETEFVLFGDAIRACERCVQEACDRLYMLSEDGKSIAVEPRDPTVFDSPEVEA